MFRNEDGSSSSEDEINAAALREACDDKFLPDSLFSKKDSSIASPHDIQPEINEEIKPSLRISDRSDTFETFRVSQCFRDYIAKKLDEKLERECFRNIELHNGSNGEKEKKKRKMNKKRRVNTEAGIKLLNSSRGTIINLEAPIEKRQKRTTKPWKFSKVSEATNVAKCQDVAVDSEWILSMIETKSWHERQKSNVFKYKKDCDGVLIEQP